MRAGQSLGRKDDGLLVNQGQIEAVLRGMALETAECEPERNLLIAVIAQAMFEAAGGMPAGVAPNRRASQDYFRAGDHSYLCELVGLDPDVVEGWMERLSSVSDLLANHQRLAA